MKQLLIDYFPLEISPQMLSEARNSSGPMLLSGILQKAEQKNHNGRIYKKQILEREIDKYQSIIKERRALGELDHPDSTRQALRHLR